MTKKELPSTFQLLTSKQPLVAIVGLTGSGKSALAMDLAKKYGGEILCADSRTVYKGMDIGTAKPSKIDQEQISHFGLDLITPDQTYSAAQFKRYGQSLIKDIRSRGNIPFIVGGTGLYVDGLLYDFQFGNKPAPGVREKLEQMDLKQLQKEALKQGINTSEINFANRRHLIRAIERGKISKSQISLASNVLVIGITTEKELLHKTIERRVDRMLAEGFETEVRALVKKYGSQAPGLLAPGYKAFAEYIAGRSTSEQAREKFIRSHKRLAKRQKTWFKRNPDITWVNTNKEADRLVAGFLSKV